MTIISVKRGICSDGVTYSSSAPRVYHYDPQIEISTDRELTQDERNRVVTELIKAAVVELMDIKGDEAAQ